MNQVSRHPIPDIHAFSPKDAPGVISLRRRIARDKFWIIGLVIDGERVMEFFTKKTAHLARSLAVNPELVDHLDTMTMTIEKGDSDDGHRDT